MMIADFDAGAGLPCFVGREPEMMIRRHANAELAPVIDLRPVVGNVPAELGMLHDVKPAR